ncbi:MAG TPA: sigma-70 family RNA polymerase sigma factor [Ktedonobacterales bacterium]
MTGDYSGQPAASGAAPSDETALVAALRRGDEATFMRLVEQYQTAMVRLAQVYVGDRAVAEEVAQETWLSALKHLDQFEARSSFKTWLFHILVNGAKTRGQRERRSTPFSALGEADDPDGEEGPSVAPERFMDEDGAHPGGWLTPPASWEQLPEDRVASQETRACVLEAIARLPRNQASVIRLRDVEGYSADEVCAMLGIGVVNQRVLLHRARSRVRQALEMCLSDD